MFALRKIDVKKCRNDVICTMLEKNDDDDDDSANNERQSIYRTPNNIKFDTDCIYQIYPADITKLKLPFHDYTVCCIFLETLDNDGDNTFKSSSSKFVHVYYVTRELGLFPTFSVPALTLHVWLCLGNEITQCKDAIAMSTNCTAMIDKCTY